jgi:GT2 family glycosyltransferase
VQFVQTQLPKHCALLQNARNGGYAGGYNEALKQVQAEYYVLLNQDVEVTENWVEKVIDEMERDENYCRCPAQIARL